MANGGLAPRWSTDGKELLHVSDRTLMSAAITLATKVTSSAPVSLFQLPAGTTDFVLSLDGQRFFLNVPEEGTAAPAVTPMTVVLNWTALLQRK